MSNKLSSQNNSPQLLYKVFREILLDPNSTEDGTSLSQHIRNDLQAVVERDVACFGPLQVQLQPPSLPLVLPPSFACCYLFLVI